MANSGTKSTAQALISGASAFTPVAESDVDRWMINELNRLQVGLFANASPTLQIVETAATSLEQQQSPKMLKAILYQLLLLQLGGAGSGATSGVGTYLFGIGSPQGVVTAPVGTLYVNNSTTGIGRFWSKTSGTGNTGWTQ